MATYRELALALATLSLAAALPALARGQAPAAPAIAQKEAPAPDGQGQLMETIGALSGVYLYNSYLAMGLLADGKAEKLYDDKAARSVLGSILKPLDNVDQQLEKAGRHTRTPADRAAVEQIRKIVALLRQQGKDLTTFWDTNRPEDGARYEAVRQEAWKQISALLGLEKKKER